MKTRKYTGIKRVAGESKATNFGFGLYLQVVYDVKKDCLTSVLHMNNSWTEYNEPERFVTVMKICEPMTMRQIREYLDEYLEENIYYGM